MELKDETNNGKEEKKNREKIWAWDRDVKGKNQVVEVKVKEKKKKGGIKLKQKGGD